MQMHSIKFEEVYTIYMEKNKYQYAKQTEENEKPERKRREAKKTTNKQQQQHQQQQSNERKKNNNTQPTYYVDLNSGQLRSLQYFCSSLFTSSLQSYAAYASGRFHFFFTSFLQSYLQQNRERTTSSNFRKREK